MFLHDAEAVELGMLGGYSTPNNSENKKIGGKLAFSTPIISRLVPNGPQRVISTSNILHLPSGLYL